MCMSSSLPGCQTSVGSVRKRSDEMADDARQLSASKVSETINEVSAEYGRVRLTSKARMHHPKSHHHDCVTALTQTWPNNASGRASIYYL